MAISSTAQMTLKLLVDTKQKRVLFAEAGKEFVDFLFNLLQLPIGTVVRLLAENTIAGTLGNLYKSIQNMNQPDCESNQTKESVDSVLKTKAPLSATPVPLLSSIQNMNQTDCESNQTKESVDSVLKPKATLSATPVPLLSRAGTGTSSASKKYYTCPNSTNSGNLHPYFSDNTGAVCPSCGNRLSTVLYYVEAPNEVAKVEEEGFVKGVVTYMVMDDLEVTPMSTISGISMLNKFNVKEVGALEERVVDFGMSQSEGLKLLEASLRSKKVLTTVFLGNTCSGLEG